MSKQGDLVNTESNDDPVRLAADNAEDFLDTLIDNLRAQIAAGTPTTVATLTDQIMDHIEASPVVQRDPLFMPLMTLVLAAVAVQRLAYREEGLTPTDDQCRVLRAIAEASRGVWAGCFSIPELASKLDMTCDEVSRHARALARLGMVEQM